MNQQPTVVRNYTDPLAFYGKHLTFSDEQVCATQRNDESKKITIDNKNKGKIAEKIFDQINAINTQDLDELLKIRHTIITLSKNTESRIYIWWTNITGKRNFLDSKTAVEEKILEITKDTPVNKKIISLIKKPNYRLDSSADDKENRTINTLKKRNFIYKFEPKNHYSYFTRKAQIEAVKYILEGCTISQNTIEQEKNSSKNQHNTPVERVISRKDLSVIADTIRTAVKNPDNSDALSQIIQFGEQIKETNIRERFYGNMAELFKFAQSTNSELLFKFKASQCRTDGPLQTDLFTLLYLNTKNTLKLPGWTKEDINFLIERKVNESEKHTDHRAVFLTYLLDPSKDTDKSRLLFSDFEKIPDEFKLLNNENYTQLITTIAAHYCEKISDPRKMKESFDNKISLLHELGLINDKAYIESHFIFLNTYIQLERPITNVILQYCTDIRMLKNQFSEIHNSNLYEMYDKTIEKLLTHYKTTSPILSTDTLRLLYNIYKNHLIECRGNYFSNRSDNPESITTIFTRDQGNNSELAQENITPSEQSDALFSFFRKNNLHDLACFHELFTKDEQSLQTPEQLLRFKSYIPLVNNISLIADYLFLILNMNNAKFKNDLLASSGIAVSVDDLVSAMIEQCTPDGETLNPKFVREIVGEDKFTQLCDLLNAKESIEIDINSTNKEWDSNNEIYQSIQNLYKNSLSYEKKIDDQKKLLKILQETVGNADEIADSMEFVISLKQMNESIREQLNKFNDLKQSDKFDFLEKEINKIVTNTTLTDTQILAILQLHSSKEFRTILSTMTHLAYFASMIQTHQEKIIDFFKKHEELATKFGKELKKQFADNPKISSITTEQMQDIATFNNIFDGILGSNLYIQFLPVISGNFKDLTKNLLLATAKNSKLDYLSVYANNLQNRLISPLQTAGQEIPSFRPTTPLLREEVESVVRSYKKFTEHTRGI